MLTRLNAIFTSSKGGAAILLILIIVPLALGIVSTVSTQFWLGIGELLYNRDMNPGVRLGVLGYGVVQTATTGFIYGFVFGGPAGAIAGLAMGA